MLKSVLSVLSNHVTIRSAHPTSRYLLSYYLLNSRTNPKWHVQFVMTTHPSLCLDVNYGRPLSCNGFGYAYCILQYWLLTFLLFRKSIESLKEIVNAVRKYLVHYTSNVNFVSCFVVTKRNWVKSIYIITNTQIYWNYFLDLHMKVHLEGDVKCPICDIFFTKRALEMHERRFHSDAQYNGNILKALRRHITNKVMCRYMLCLQYVANVINY